MVVVVVVMRARLRSKLSKLSKIKRRKENKERRKQINKLRWKSKNNNKNQMRKTLIDLNII